MVSERNYAIDGLRGLFAIGVMFYHLCMWTEVALPPLLDTFLLKIAIYGVAGFFIISGYSLMLSYADRLHARSDIGYFFKRRFLRIAPLYIAVCLVYLAGRIAFCDADCRGFEEDLQRFILNITLLFGFVEPGRTSFVVGGWSIGIEWVFYLFFPLVLAITSGWRLWALALATLLYNQYHMNIVLDASQSFGENFPLYAQAPALAFYFIIGMVMARYREVLARSCAHKGLWLMALLVAIIALPIDGPASVDIVTGVNGFALLALTALLVASISTVRLTQPRARKVALFLAEISYALYLGHFIVYEVVRRVVADASLQIGLTALVTMVAAYATYRLVEKPFQQWGRRGSLPSMAEAEAAITR